VTAPGETGSDAIGYRISFRGRSDSAAELEAVLDARGDPGYRSTGRVVAEAALTLVEQSPAGRSAGVVTPSMALGVDFLSRLPSVGMSLSIGDVGAV
jgi:short subunit dehydrogenase-like uncharacterized protein